MAQLSDDGVDIGGGLTITSHGVRGEVEPGAQGGSRSGGEVDPLEQALGQTEGVRLGDAATLSALELTGGGRRDGTGGDEGALQLKLPRVRSGERQAVLVEENGEYAWFFPERRSNGVPTNLVEIPLEAAPGTRDGLGSWARKVVRVVAVKAAGAVAEKGIGFIDRKRNPHQIRSWSPDDYREDVDPYQSGDLSGLSGPAPVLLMVHGFMGGVSTTFHDFDPGLVAAIHDAYDGRTMAFGHPTIALSPRENAEWFLDQLPDGVELQFDIMAHSRGGLVAREIADVLARSRKRVGVRRIVFVATPNDGTPLADTSKPQGLLDGLTNLISKIPGADTFAAATGLVTDILFDGVLANLDGVTAMLPGGDYINELNARAMPGVELRSISTEFEPRSDAGIVRTNLDRMVDLYFGGLRNDRVVPTIATHLTEGSFRIPPGHRLVLDSSRSVHHSSFWDNDRAAEQLEKWLRPSWDPSPIPDTETDPLAEVSEPPDPVTLVSVGEAIGRLGKQAVKSIEDLVGGPIDSTVRPRKGTGDAVVVLPGIMGSYLRSKATGSTIWVSPRSLNRGHFGQLMLGGGDTQPIETAGVHRTYLPLVSNLAAKRDVFVVDYDWRLDIRESAKRLAQVIEDEVLAADPDRTVHFVAHSMGGLVARTFAHDHRELWKQSIKDDGRLVMLGTPNRGSYAMVLTLTGNEGLLKVLAVADFANRHHELLEVVASFPGVYQLLPAPGAGPEGDDLDEIYRARRWGPSSIRQDLLDLAKGLYADLDRPIDPDRLTYIAGFGSDTPYRLRVDGDGEFSLGQFKEGDGRVPHALGLLDGVQTYYSAAGHGALIGDPKVLESLDSILRNEDTKHLAKIPPPRRGDEPEPELTMRPLGEIDPEPARIGPTRSGATSISVARNFEGEVDRALGVYLGGNAEVISRPRVRVKVVNASLEKTSYPVAVGHYRGVPPEGAEGFLNRRLDNALGHRQRVGLYPERAGTAAYIRAPLHRRPRGAIVLGLGDFGSLTQRSLTEAMTEGAIAAALNARESSDAIGRLEMGIASVLVGSPGRYGVTLKESVIGLTEGVARAMIELDRMGVDVSITEFELIELYELRAEEATYAARSLPNELTSDVTAAVDIEIVDQMEVRDGARTGGPGGSGDSGTPWVRMMIEFPSDEEATSDKPVRRFEVSKLERGAQANRLEHRVNFPKIREFVRDAVRRPDVGNEVSHTLYELLFPHRTKLDLDRSENLHLVLDEHLAQIPWELVADRDDRGSVRPLALRAGMLRQLRSDDHTRIRSELSARRSALVIGDPPTALPRLPGARDEALAVVDALVNSDYEVTDRVYSDSQQDPVWVDVQNALLARPYNIVHIAAHGVYDESDGGIRSGVVIGEKEHHRLSTLDFAAMSATPDFVFLNACHLGRLGTWLDERDGVDDDEREERRTKHARPAEMAASVARQLMKNGVKALVVAGWAVDDIAAKAFSERLYGAMLAGERFGAAVGSAREAARRADHGRSNTWGAYQCYGDPDFRLSDTSDWRDEATPPVGLSELRRDVQNIGTSASDAATASHREWLVKRLDALLDRAGSLADRPVIQQEVGRARGELGDFEGAVAAYSTCLGDRKAAMTLRSIEQLANFEARAAAKRVYDDDRIGHTNREVQQAFRDAEQRITWLIDKVGETDERCALLGSLFKKRASVLPTEEELRAKGRAEDEFDAERDGYARQSYEWYERAWELSSDGKPNQNSYHTLNWLQMRAIVGERSGAARARRALAEIRVQLSEAALRHDREYWDIAGPADLALTDAVVSRTGRSENLQLAKQRYLDAFHMGRSSLRQRDSAIEHIRDLARLVDSRFADDLSKLARELGDWEPD